MNRTKSLADANSPGIGVRLLAGVIVLVGCLLATSEIQTWLGSSTLALNFISPSLWRTLVGSKAGSIADSPTVDVPFGMLALPVCGLGLLLWLGGAILLSWRTRTPFGRTLTLWGFAWFWWCLVDLWEWLWIIAGGVGWSSLSTVLTASPQFWLSGCLAGWLTTFFVVKCLLAPAAVPRSDSSGTGLPNGVSLPKELSSPRDNSLWWLWLACGLYIIVFTTMNWQLYFNLFVPHGDSAMYEEHLWNLTHGKGFRSYLERGWFFSEHIQFVHVFLLPLYLIWPSHLLLELCESTALALGAFPVFWMTRRFMERHFATPGEMPNGEAAGDSSHAKRAGWIGLAAAVAYLLYAPMQFLDIEIDLKTFRPEAFGIPLLLLTLDQLERRYFWGTLLGLAITLTVKEDYTVIFGPLGLWIAFAQRDPATESSPLMALPSKWSLRLWAGLGLSLFSVAYLWLATRVIMPAFRFGDEIHYAGYFKKFGNSPEQIVTTMVTQPGLLFGELATTTTALYVLMLLAPLAFIPLCSPSRLAVGLPLFGILCLNELARDPRHQFHAPLVAVTFWAMSAGLPRCIILMERLGKYWAPSSKMPLKDLALSACGHLLWTSALATGLFLSLGPLGLPFWDTGSNWYWKTLYGPSRRGELFARVAANIPLDSRVVSTDFVHPRFTHHERSYDYSGYHRAVSGDAERVPPDADYIVIDTHHRYSTIKQPSDIPEYRDHPDEWELLPDVSEGWFIVLKRRQ